MKIHELAGESIPGCVLQCYVLMITSGAPSTGALFSIGISALTTGYSIAMITLDTDLDTTARKNMPNFFGFIPDDHGLRSRCFKLMTIITALHNLSRSIGCALLAASGGVTRVMTFVCGEMLVYMGWKAVRRDFLTWHRIDGVAGIIFSSVIRIIEKIIADFSGMLPLRHP